MNKRYVSWKEVTERSCLSRTEIGRRVKTGRFPQPIRLGPYQTSRTVFVGEEFDRWIDDQMTAYRQRPE
jgi:predicted DNA-binding transcriptional regulator AlpA